LIVVAAVDSQVEDLDVRLGWGYSASRRYECSDEYRGADR
jgi:hypothetical protein